MSNQGDLRGIGMRLGSMTQHANFEPQCPVQHWLRSNAVEKKHIWGMQHARFLGDNTDALCGEVRVDLRLRKAFASKRFVMRLATCKQGRSFTLTRNAATGLLKTFRSGVAHGFSIK
jgi:hypothetical protein